jgi:hypothetical protein
MTFCPPFLHQSTSDYHRENLRKFAKNLPSTKIAQLKVKKRLAV